MLAVGQLARAPMKFDGDDDTVEVGDGERAHRQGYEVLTEREKKQLKRKRRRKNRTEARRLAKQQKDAQELK